MAHKTNLEVEFEKKNFMESIFNVKEANNLEKRRLKKFKEKNFFLLKYHIVLFIAMSLFFVREAFKNKNDETYGIFHMLVVPPPYQHMENSFVIFYCLKRISDSL